MMFNNVVLASCKLCDTTQAFQWECRVQSAELHTLWGIKCGSAKVRGREDLRFSEEGYPFWRSGRVWFVLAQCRDNMQHETLRSPLVPKYQPANLLHLFFVQRPNPSLM